MTTQARITNPIYQGMWTRPAAASYFLDGDAFAGHITTDITKQTGLRKSEWLGDWWVHPANNPVMTWQQLLDYALRILHTEATRLFVRHLYLAQIPTYTYTDTPRVYMHVRGAKRINADCGAWYDFSGAVGLAGLVNPQREEILLHPPVRNTGEQFRLYGKDESCQVEGTWFDWCCFACNVLANDNTKACAPALYEPALRNDNY